MSCIFGGNIAERILSSWSTIFSLRVNLMQEGQCRIEKQAGIPGSCSLFVTHSSKYDGVLIQFSYYKLKTFLSVAAPVAQ